MEGAWKETKIFIRQMDAVVREIHKELGQQETEFLGKAIKFDAKILKPKLKKRVIRKRVERWRGSEEGREKL